MSCLIFSLIACSQEHERSQSLEQQIQTRYDELKQSHFPQSKDVTVEDASRMITQKAATVLDVREQNERAVSMIPRAVDLNTFEQQENDKRTPIIVYCTIGYRSAVISKQLQEKGYEAVNLQGGILSWIAAGQVVQKDSVPVRVVHTYDADWAYVPDEYTAIFE